MKNKTRVLIRKTAAWIMIMLFLVFLFMSLVLLIEGDLASFGIIISISATCVVLGLKLRSVDTAKQLQKRKERQEEDKQKKGSPIQELNNRGSVDTALSYQRTAAKPRVEFCIKCGKYLKADEDFCPRCGAPAGEDLLIDRIADFLRRMGYEVQCYDCYIIARHAEFSESIFLKFASIDNYRQYETVGSVILTPTRFRTLIRNLEYLLSKEKRGKREFSSRLEKDVITAFGWHADEPEEVRHRALEEASAVWGEEHILSLLRLLINTWSQNPALCHHCDTVKYDYSWFENNMRGPFYRRLKKQIIDQLRAECNRILQLSPSFRTLARDVRHWFIIVY